MLHSVVTFWSGPCRLDRLCCSVFDQHQNFEEQMQGMKTQLIQLSTLLRLLDLAFWNYLGMDRAAVGLYLLMVSSDISFLPLQSLKIPVTSTSVSAGC